MAQQTISAADRIRELSAINAEVAAMLQSAGLAIDSLTDRALKSALIGGIGHDRIRPPSRIQSSTPMAPLAHMLWPID